MVLETKRLILRNYTLEDLEALYKIFSDEQTMQYYPAPFSKEKTKNWILWNLDNYKKYGFGLWAVMLKNECTFIGDCGITLQNIDGSLLPEIGYHIHKDFWQQGFAKESACAVRNWAFTNTQYNALYSYMKWTNIASCKTASSIGMQKVKEYSDAKNKITYVYAITKTKWQKIK